MRLPRPLPVCLALALAPAVPAAAADGFMSVQDLQFAPATVHINRGEKVDFNFEGPSPHNAVLRRGQIDRYDSGITGPGMTKAHRFEHAGSFALVCDLHPEMKARVMVGVPETRSPRLTRARALAGRRKVRLTFRTSERSVVTVAIGTRRVSKVLASGARSIIVGRLRAGRRTARIRATDGWGNQSASLKRSFTVR